MERFTTIPVFICCIGVLAYVAGVDHFPLVLLAAAEGCYIGILFSKRVVLNVIAGGKAVIESQDRYIESLKNMVDHLQEENENLKDGESWKYNTGGQDSV